jgi:hypothetical protein
MREIIDLPLHYDKDTMYIVGNAKTTQSNPITFHYNNRFFIILIIDIKHEVIIDAAASVMVSITNEFIRSLFVDYSMKLGFESMANEITRRYHGSSQQGLLVAWKDAYKKYSQIVKQKN